MQRRNFLAGCGLAIGAAGIGAMRDTLASVTPRAYSRALLVDVHGEPIKASRLIANTNYVFQYPFAATPCFLLNLGHAATGVAAMRRADGETYRWDGGAGASRSIVAFSAICAHKLAYPTREVSFIRFQRDRSATSDGNVIHCCADHSVYDPAAGARVMSGPAPQPLAAILLEYDAQRDQLSALGTIGAEQFDAFFRKYDFRLALDYGPGKAKLPVGAATMVREMTEYCRQTIQC
ncbi:MAG TPA: twin-arginine translocation signal domain-containing protein [Casimicrobiaceae bacterium]|nr:twin-arginine translocation signal domain-containing protein [Casimicrobiaceae bacterium]